MADVKSHEAPAHEAASLPVMIPAKLVGRDALLGRIYTRLRENQPVQIYGAPGMGKTALAATLAAAYTEQPGGVLWLNVDNTTMDELIVRVGRAYGVDEITNSDYPLGMIGAVANTLTQHKPLVVLDGKLDEQVAQGFIGRCVIGLPAMIIGQKPVSETWTAVGLEGLDANHAAALFKQTAGLADAPDPDVDRLVAMLRNVPMAIVIAAATAKATKQLPVQYLNALTQIPGYNTADPILLALTAAFRSLNNALQGLILMMGVTFTRQASTELVSAISGAPQDTIQQVMNVLANQNLVERFMRYGAPYYRLHEVVYGFAQTSLRTSGRLEGLQSKLRDAALTYAKKYSNADTASHDKLAAEMDLLMAVAAWSADNNDRDTANQLIVTLTQAGDFIQERGYRYELLRLRKLATSSMTAFPAYPPEPALPPEETTPATTDTSTMRMLFDEEDEEDDLAYDEEDSDEDEIVDEDEALDEDDLDEDEDESLTDEETLADEVAALMAQVTAPPAMSVPASSDPITVLRASLVQARQQGDKRRQASLLRSIGAAQAEQKMEIEAITTYSEAMSIYEELGDETDLLDVLDILSTLMVKTENSPAAVLHAQQGVRLAEKLKDDETRMQLLITLGDARQQVGESETGERAYTQALEIARSSDDSQNEAIILLKLGYALLDNGKTEHAIQTWEQALQLFRDQSKRAYEGQVLGGLGTAYGELDQWSEAISYSTSALHIAREVGNKEEEALQLSRLGYASVQAEQLGQAVTRYRQALHLAYEDGNRETIVSSIIELVRLLMRSPSHLSIAQLLIDDAAQLEPNDREVKSLKDRIQSEMLIEEANAVQQKPVNGTARDYASNAYRLLEA